MSEITAVDCECESVQALHRKTPYLFCEVSKGFFSVARFAGGMNYNGSSYLYQPATDTLIRDDVVKVLCGTEKKAIRAKKTKAAKAQTAFEVDGMKFHVGGVDIVIE